MKESLKCGVKLYTAMNGEVKWVRDCGEYAAFIIEEDDPAKGMIDYVVYCRDHFYSRPDNMKRKAFVVSGQIPLGHMEMIP